MLACPSDDARGLFNLPEVTVFSTPNMPIIMPSLDENINVSAVESAYRNAEKTSPKGGVNNLGLPDFLFSYKYP